MGNKIGWIDQMGVAYIMLFRIKRRLVTTAHFSNSFVYFFQTPLNSNKMVLILDKCAEILGCKVTALRDRLNHPMDRNRVMAELQGRAVQTTYEDNGFTKTFAIGGISMLGADKLMAYGPLPRPYAISVAGYYHCKFGIRLKYPFTCCVIERFPVGAEDRYFPLELLQLVPEDLPSSSNLPKWVGRKLFTEISTQKPGTSWSSESSDNDDEHYLNFGRDQLSQDPVNNPIW